MKPTNFPTNTFSCVGIDFMEETDYKKPNRTKFSVNTLRIDTEAGNPFLTWAISRCHRLRFCVHYSSLIVE